ncbi:MAG: TonB-dependent receptor [Sinimarinibacterium sp.]|jgi:outer membrane receptor protein involved in Fe transport
MKKLMIAATMTAVVSMVYTASAVAQTSNKAAEDDEFLSILQEDQEKKNEEQPEATSDSGNTGNSDADDEAASSETAPAAAQTAPASSEPAPAATPAPSVTADGKPAAPLDVIPVPQHEPSPAPTQQAQARPRAVEEIIVTAQRREESVQDVPISITVFDQKQLDNANITNASDIATYTPSLSANTRFGTETATFALRGFTQDLRTTASVATYFAEVVAPRGQTVQTSGDGAGPGAFFDLQNVQVLKGPQGTLFGRNTTGGAVLLVPQKPKDEFEGYLELSGGDFKALRGQGVANVPVTDSFRLRFAIDSNSREGHLKNYTGIGADDLGDTHFTAFRLSGVLDITDSLENYTILSYVDSETNGQNGLLFACNPDVQSSPLSLLTGPACTEQLSHQAEIGKDGYYDTATTLKTPISLIEEKRLINTTTWLATENLTVKNIFAYAHLYTLNGSNVFGTQFTETAATLLGLGLPAGLVDPNRELAAGASVLRPGVPVTSQETWVEEIQLQGNAFDDRLIWQAGAYYENSRPDGFSGGRGVTLLYCDFATVEGDPSEFSCNDPLAGQLGGIIDQSYKVEYLNRALYTQGTFNILERLSMTAGLRYTWDETEGQGTRSRYTFVLTQPQAPIVSNLSSTAESRAPTGLLEFDYKPTDDVMLYGKYIRGYRQGSVNMAADPGIDTWQPEKVDTYEIGAKTSFEGFLSGRFNIAAFYNDLTDMQLQTGYISQTAGTTTAIFNAGKARIAGAEVEAFLELTENLSATLSYAFLDTELLEQDDNCGKVEASGGTLAGRTCTPIAVVGDELPFAAKNAYVVSLNYRLPLSEQLGAISLGTTYVYTGERRAAATGTTPFDMLDPFSLLNLNASWASIFGSAFNLSMFATNMLDEEYATYHSGTYNALGFEDRTVGLPRMFGARLKYNFGASAE